MVRLPELSATMPRFYLVLASSLSACPMQRKELDSYFAVDPTSASILYRRQYCHECWQESQRWGQPLDTPATWRMVDPKMAIGWKSRALSITCKIHDATVARFVSNGPIRQRKQN